MEGPTSSCGLRNRITLLTLQEHDDDYDDDKYLIFRNEEFVVGHRKFANSSLVLCPVRGHRAKVLCGFK